jgi:hypothetical protein
MELPNENSDKTLIALFAMLAGNFCVAQTLVDAPAPHAFLDKTTL